MLISTIFISASMVNSPRIKISWINEYISNLAYGCRIEASGSECKCLYVKLRKCSIECQTFHVIYFKMMNVKNEHRFRYEASTHTHTLSHLAWLTRVNLYALCYFFFRFWCETNLQIHIKINKLKIYSVWIWYFSDFLLYIVS